jgi:hypothetical protein
LLRLLRDLTLFGILYRLFLIREENAGCSLICMENIVGTGANVCFFCCIIVA